MKITLYPGGSHNYEQVFLECVRENPYSPCTFTGRREGLQTRVRIVTTVPYLIEMEPEPKSADQESSGLSVNTYGLEAGRDWEYIG